MHQATPQARSGRAFAANKRTLEEELSHGRDCSIIDLVDSVVERAYAIGASDIHIDPSRETVRIRFRIDGVLQDIASCTRSIHPELISRIKVLTGLRTDEHHTAQDGRFRHLLPDASSLDVRVSIVPTYHGENAVLRLLTNQGSNFSLETLGFSVTDSRKIERALRKTSGMILSTGPTGSGKTTTLYTLIKMLNAPEVSVVTIEDPIEYSIEAIEQIQVNARTGLTFANGLRSILRQDPDIIMVGEIRDAETAGIAVNTALTGHLLLSTLHTSDSTTTLPRLSDMGIDTYLLAATINIAIGQRLVRKICSTCRTERSLTREECAMLNELLLQVPLENKVPLFWGQGCDECGGTGYKGRLSINEVLVAEPNIREAILRRASADELRVLAATNGMTSMLDDGFTKIREGRTTIEEVLRVVHE